MWHLSQALVDIDGNQAKGLKAAEIESAAARERVESGLPQRSKLTGQMKFGGRGGIEPANPCLQSTGVPSTISILSLGSQCLGLSYPLENRLQLVYFQHPPDLFSLFVCDAEAA
jgi:hypothetical protein